MNKNIAVPSHDRLEGILDPDMKSLLDEAAGNPPMEELPVEEAREGDKLFLGGLMEKAPVFPCSRIADVHAAGKGGSIPLRIYVPESGKAPYPVMMFFHGGGWVFAAMDAVDRNMRLVCSKLECIVASVDYRLAPEYPYPAAPDDCFAATEWVSGNIGNYGGDNGRLVVCGDSAGGNLSASVCLMARDRGGPMIAGQVLIYPATDLVSFETKSYSDYADGFLISKSAVRWLIGMYVPDKEIRRRSYVSPLHAGNLEGLPPAVIATAEFDPLRDEAYAYAQKLERSGVETDYACYTGMLHAFFYMSYVSKGAKAACEDLYGRMRRLMK